VPLSTSAEAIVLRVRPYAESDKIVTFLTDHAGKLTGIAKGAKNSRRRFPNCLDPLARVRVYYRPRSGPGLVFMERCDLRRPASVYSELPRLAYAQYLAELVDVLTEEAHAVPEMFALLDLALELLVERPATAPFLRAFEMKLLTHAGYAPPLRNCSRCGADLFGRDSAILDPEHNYTFCSDCAPGASAPRCLALRGATIEGLEALKSMTLPDAQQQHFDSRTMNESSLALSALLAPHLRRPLRSLQVLRQVRHE